MLTIHVNPKSKLPLYEQIYRYIKTEIQNGNLPYQSKLPSTRNLSMNLQVSRNTVDMAYAQLLSEGYIDSVPKSGYFVCQIEQLELKPFHPLDKKENAKPFAKEGLFTYQYDFSPFAIDIHHFPLNTWRKLSKRCLNVSNNDLFLLGDRQGDCKLRSAIEQYLHESRGVQCNKDSILIGAGVDYLLQILSQILQHPHLNSKIAMENPTYIQAYRIFKGLGITTVPVSLDSHGIRIDQLYESNANVAYVTPSHQYPLGIVMPIKRRQELLEWANSKPNHYIIEDDHDSEFRYKGKPIPALQGLDEHDKVIYIGTFSRSIAPAIRVGYLVLPKDLLLLYQQNYMYYASTVSRIDQEILSTFIQEGYYDRHLNRMRKHYKSKHDALLQALKIFKNHITIHGENAGLHLVVTFHVPYQEEMLCQKAKEAGIHLYGLKEHFISFYEKSYEPTCLLGYANLSIAQIEEGIFLLYQTLFSKNP